MGGTDQGVFLCTPGPLEYLDNDKLWGWFLSHFSAGCLFADRWGQISASATPGVQLGWSSWTTSCLSQGGVGGASQPPASAWHGTRDRKISSAAQPPCTGSGEPWTTLPFPCILLNASMTQKSQLQPDLQTSADVAGVSFSLWSRALALVGYGGSGDNNWRKK